jgi:hypothetical protein
MPVVKRFGNYVIRVYFADHNPPHVHVVGRDFEALVSIKDAAVFRGNLPANVRDEALEWISANRAFLSQAWEDCR